MRTKYFAFTILAVLALVLGACGPTTINQAAPTTDRIMNVNGLGVVYLTPDIAYINIGVGTQKPDAAEAVEANKAQTTKVIQAIKDSGVDDKDIRTTNFSIWSNPQYDPAGTGQILSTSYSVDNTVNVTIRDLDKLGDLLDAAVQAGANNIYSIQFDVDNKNDANKEARTLAVENARMQAQELAAATGVELGEIQSISYYESSPTQYFEGKGGGGGGDVASAAVPIQPGQLAISVNVNITYFIK
ncbi:MAG TPA: SIMPL domain-containing protein [Anaerolineales bacterium]|nr:SIMPL domain-containing protein [Anaerolineales bacterium]HNM38596.1 SIMPL domain-containing protein [Anaerolineales bacterium]